jgi:regulator of sigma E protease
MDTLVNFLPYLGYIMLAITILVFVHEMGHFLTAKLFGMRVERFSVGFPPKLYGKQIGETEYVFGATPLGGYVKILGMVDESMDTDGLSRPPEPWEFRAKPVWQRIIVITAGVIFNIILAWIIFTLLKGTFGEEYIPADNVRAVYVQDGSLGYDIGLRTGDRLVAIGGEPLERFQDYRQRMVIADPLTITVERDGQLVTLDGPRDIMTQLGRTDGDLGINIQPPIISGVAQGSPADSAGLQSGDRIVRIGDRQVAFWTELSDAVQASQGQPVTVQFARPDSLVDGAAVLDSAATATDLGDEMLYTTQIRPMQADDRYQLGVAPISVAQMLDYYGIRSERYGPIEAMGAGWAETTQQTRNIVANLGRVFSGRDDLRENLGGPVMVAKVARDAARDGWRYFWQIVGLLSITLAVLNILPIPALDGGHLVFLIYEGITRREPSLKVRMILQQVGMVVLLIFMVFLFANDFIRLFTS